MGVSEYPNMSSALFLLFLTHYSSALSVESVKAASPLTNCGCQCSSLTFRDSSGVVQGNCKTVDSTGAQWCYVDSYSTCQDLVPSQRFPHNPWSYEACATPALGSPICPVVPNHDHHPVVVPATPQHVHVQPVAQASPEIVHVQPIAPATPEHVHISPAVPGSGLLHPDERQQDSKLVAPKK